MKVTEKYIKQRIAVIEGWFEKYPAEVTVHRVGKNNFFLGKIIEGGAVQSLTSCFDIRTLENVALIILNHKNIINQLNKKEL